MDNRHKNWNGSKWIGQERRLAIYLRDGMACCWCGATLEDDTRLTLDHVIPVSKGGNNTNGNLITSCSKCNTSRGNRSVVEFANAVADYLNHDTDPKRIITHVNNCRRRVVKIKEAKTLMARRNISTVMAEMK